MADNNPMPETCDAEEWTRRPSNASESEREYTRGEMRTACRNNYNAGWHHAVEWLLQRADSHAGRWTTMDPREALKDAAREMEKLHAES